MIVSKDENKRKRGRDDPLKTTFTEPSEGLIGFGKLYF